MNTTLRFNGFAMIHKALRGMLYDAAMTLQHTHFADTAATEAAFKKIELILDLFDDHADHEDALILPMAKDHNQELVHSFEQEHVKDRSLCAELRDGMAAYHNAQLPVERIIAGNKVFIAFNEFIAFNLNHMNREETVLNETLWANYEDRDIMAVNQKLAASVAPEKAIQNVTWMFRTCNNMEIAGFIKMVQATAPPERANMLVGLAKNELSPAKWEAIEQMLNEAVPA